MKLSNTLAVTALVAGSLFTGSPLLQAQTTATNTVTNTPVLHQRVHGDFATTLNLTDDQKPKFKAILQSTAEKRKALHEDKSLSAADRQAKTKAIQDDFNAQIKALLTEEQFAKWQKMTAHQRPMPAAHAILTTNAAVQK